MSSDDIIPVAGPFPSDQSASSPATGERSGVDQVAKRMTELLEAHIEPAESPIELAVGKAIQPGHITQMIAVGRERQQNRHSERMARIKSRPQTIKAILIIVLTAVIIVSGMALFTGHPEIVLPIIGTITGLAGAGFGAYHYGKSQGASAAAPAQDNLLSLPSSLNTDSNP